MALLCGQTVPRDGYCQKLDLESNRTANFLYIARPENCQACKPGDTQVLNVTRRPDVSRSNEDIHQGAVFLEGGCCDPGLAAQSFIVQALVNIVNLDSSISHSCAAAHSPE